ncbi:hypothetical protein MTBSS4_270006 [Magnetospirillum sp. SS-4]|nr:hypothetical protein MTBSS4_270006 [Magnetospirillum sp. SS-4]
MRSPSPISRKGAANPTGIPPERAAERGSERMTGFETESLAGIVEAGGPESGLAPIRRTSGS